MTLSISITFPHTAPLPTGFQLFRAPVWPIQEYGLDLSTTTFGLSSFMVIPLWVEATRTWSAISNYSVINRADIDKLALLQPEATRKSAMGWLVSSGTGVAPMFTGDESNWENAQTIRVGTMLWGDQIFAASTATFSVSINGQWIECRKVLPFKREYWLTRPTWMFPRATIAGVNNKVSYEWGKGAVTTMLQVLEPAEFPFAGGKFPAAFWIPANWCGSVT